MVVERCDSDAAEHSAVNKGTKAQDRISCEFSEGRCRRRCDVAVTCAFSFLGASQTVTELYSRYLRADLHSHSVSHAVDGVVST